MASFRKTAAMASVVAHVLDAVGAASLTNCGGEADLLQLSELVLEPDPIQHREPFTITATGTLGKSFSGGLLAADVDLKVMVLGVPVVDRSTQKHTEFQIEPAVPGGEVKLVIGPVNLPTLPGMLDVSGKVVITDGDGTPVACLALDLHSPLLAETLEEPLAEERPPAPEAGLGRPTSCSKAGDRLHDVAWSTSDEWTVVGATLDEALSQVSFHNDLELFVGRWPLMVKGEVPVLYAPGVPPGHVELRYRPVVPPPSMATALASPVTERWWQALWPKREPPPGPHVVGNVTAVDKSGAEIVCIHLDNQPAPPPSGRDEKVPSRSAEPSQVVVI